MTTNKGKKKPKAEELFPEAFVVRDNIALLCRVYGITDEELATAIGTSRETLRRRKKEPWKYTEYEKKIIANALHTSVSELYNDMKAQILSSTGG
jgi:lambda repressor-like predicted transcriptional regulator